MAYVKIHTIKQSAAHVAAAIRYAANAEKTEAAVCRYSDDHKENDKAAADCFVTAIGLSSAQNAPREFAVTKRRWGKEGGRLAYHLIQSFAPEDDVTPELAHEIGCRFVCRLFPGFEAVVGTHLDRAHIHNHIIVNAVCLADGHKPHLGKGYITDTLRRISDELCREYGLPVMEERRRREAEKKPVEVRHYRRGSWKETMNRDIRWAAAAARKKEDVLRCLQGLGYTIDGSGSHVKLQPPGNRRFYRLDSFYTNDELQGMYSQPMAPFSSAGPLRMKDGRRLRGQAAELNAVQAKYLQMLIILGTQETQRCRMLSFREYKDGVQQRAAELRYLSRAHICSLYQLHEVQKMLKEECRELKRESYWLTGQKRRLQTGIASGGTSLTEEEVSQRHTELERAAAETGRKRREAERELRLVEGISNAYPRYAAAIEEYTRGNAARRAARERAVHRAAEHSMPQSDQER